MNLEYRNEQTPTPTPDLVSRVAEQFRAAGCRALTACLQAQGADQSWRRHYA